MAEVSADGSFSPQRLRYKRTGYEKLICGFFISGMASACPGAITETSIGGVRLGMSKTEIARSGLPHSKSVIEIEGMQVPEYKITICRNAEVMVHFDDNERIDFIRTSSAYFKTPEEAHVGTTPGQLQALYEGVRL